MLCGFPDVYSNDASVGGFSPALWGLYQLYVDRPACHPCVRVHCCLMAISAFHSHLTLTYHLSLA
ncbi:hypothetical protein ACRRTK_022175 [Alexandromys fortis]